jgi:D-3-phosphoglycerate dehydrogenase / 2-oxoglutarate reductase
MLCNLYKFKHKKMKILANDGIDKNAIKLLEKNKYEVITTKVAQEQLVNYINEKNIDILLVRSATKAKRDVIDGCKNLKLIGRGGVGMDNIDVAYAQEKGMKVINTPAASSNSVAELVFAHLFTGVRMLHDANRNMPLEGDTNFNGLKKAYAEGIELQGKTLGIIGFGRIGQAVAKMAIGLGMQVKAYDKFVDKANIEISFFNNQKIQFEIQTTSLENVLNSSDFLSIHTPATNGYLIGEKELENMPNVKGIINCSRGGTIDEVALLKALDNDKLFFAGLDVFENEPNPAVQVLMHPKVSLTPHIGAATLEAQERIGIELAEQIISIFKK